MNRRVFAAIDISEDARRDAAEYIENLRKEFPDSSVRWERPEKLHITVKFAGTLNEEELEVFSERVKAAAGSLEPFRIKIAGTGAFVKRRGPSVLWLGVEQLTYRDPIGRIASMLGHEGRPFHPHITIARIKDSTKGSDLIEKHQSMVSLSEEFEVNEVVIYQSTLLPKGSVYSKLLTTPFNRR